MAAKTTLRTVRVAVLAIAMVACEDTTAPPLTDALDTDAALADYEALETAFDSDVWTSFRALGGRTPFAGSPAAFEAVGALEASRSGDPAGFARGLARRLAGGPHLAGPARGPIISGWHRGTTFVYEPATDEYTPDLTREGAPATGVRFVLYEVDDTGIPILAEERGYADLIDEGDDAAEDIALRLLVVLEQQTVIDYRTTLDHDAASGALTVGGFVAGDGVRLDFDIAARARGEGSTATLDLDFDMAVEARSFSIEGTVRGIREEDDDGSGSVDVTVRHRHDSMRVDIEGVEGVLSGTVYLDGDVFATVSGPEDEPTFLNGEGQPLRGGELLVLIHVVDIMEDVFDFLEDLVDPVNELVLLGVIL